MKISETQDSIRLKTHHLKKLKRVKKILTDEVVKPIEKLTPQKPLTIVEKVIAKSLKRMLPKLKDLSKNPKGLGYIILAGNVCKEFIGTAVYTIQAFTNEDLPKDKRKFVGMYDLGVGVVSTTLQLVAGVATIIWQTPFIEKMLGGSKAKKFPGWAKAFAGIAYAVPIAIQTIFIKRLVAPAVATPVAGMLKNNWEAREAAKQDKQPQQITQPQPVVQLVPDKPDIQITKENAFNLYKSFKAKL